MRIIFKDSSIPENSGFVDIELNLDYIPRVGDEVEFHPVFLNKRMLDHLVYDYTKDKPARKTLKATVLKVSHYFRSNTRVSVVNIEVKFIFIFEPN